MHSKPLLVTLSYPEGGEVSFPGRGALVYAAEADQSRAFAVTGFLTLGDMAQLMNELMDSFGEEDIQLALSLAFVARRMSQEEDADASD